MLIVPCLLFPSGGISSIEAHPESPALSGESALLREGVGVCGLAVSSAKACPLLPVSADDLFLLEKENLVFPPGRPRQPPSEFL